MSQAAEMLAAEARNLDENPILQTALTSLRAAALETLADIDPLDPNAIMAVQADLRAIANLRGVIKNMVLAGQGQRHKPVA